MRRLQPFANALAQALLVPVTIVPMADERSLIEALIAGAVDHAPLSATGYAAARLACGCVEPLARARRDGSGSGFRVALLARSDGPASAAALRAASLVVAGRDSFLTRYALFELRRRGLTIGDLSLIDAGTPVRAAARFAGGAGDALIGWTPARSGARAPDETASLLLGLGMRLRPAPIWVSPIVHDGAHVVRTGVPEPAKAILRDRLVGLRDADRDAYDVIEPVRAGGFEIAKVGDYAALSTFVRDLAAGPSTASGEAAGLR